MNNSSLVAGIHANITARARSPWQGRLSPVLAHMRGLNLSSAWVEDQGKFECEEPRQPSGWERKCLELLCRDGWAYAQGSWDDVEYSDVRRGAWMYWATYHVGPYSIRPVSREYAGTYAWDGGRTLLEIEGPEGAEYVWAPLVWSPCFDEGRTYLPDAQGRPIWLEA